MNANTPSEHGHALRNAPVAQTDVLGDFLVGPDVTESLSEKVLTILDAEFEGSGSIDPVRTH
jgi:hypothetical protein